MAVTPAKAGAQLRAPKAGFRLSPEWRTFGVRRFDSQCQSAGRKPGWHMA